MFCYNCGTDCKENRFCSNCGCRVGKPEEREKIYPDPPLGVYKIEGGYLEVCADGMQISQVQSSIYVHVKHYVFYKNIWEVIFRTQTIARGPYIAIREKGGIMPIPQSNNDWNLDFETVHISVMYEKIAEQIYTFLAKCAEINRQQEIRE